jgi:PAS domain S-box-containing protein
VNTSQREIEAIFDHAVQFMGLLSPDGVVLRANPASLEAVGAAAEEVIGRPFWETPWWTHSPPLQERLREAIEQAAAGHFERFAATHPHSGGGIMDVDFSLTPVPDEDGRVVFLVAEGRDVTLQKRAERALSVLNEELEQRVARRTAELHESQERMRAVVDTAVEAIITIDRYGIVHTFNPAGERMFGYTADEIIGHNVRMLMPSPYAEEHNSYIVRYRRTGKSKVIGRGRQLVARRKDGSTFPIEIAVSEVGHLQLFTGIIRDVSERQQAEEQLRQADRLSAIGTLAAGLGHDMNNVLLPVRARLDLIEGADLSPVVKKHFVEIRKSAEYLQDLADGLHLLALDPDSASATETTTLDQWWDQVHTLLGRALPKGVRFSASLPRDLPDIPVAPHRLTQAVLNMLINSATAVGDEGRVRLWAESDEADEVVRLGITDDGCGMDEEVRSRALEPFFTTKSRGLGTGLGLSLVHGVVLACGGSVDIESAPGEGTTITLSFPAVARAVEEERTEEVAQSPLAVVSVQDPRAASLMAHLLEMAGFEVEKGKTDPSDGVRLWVTEARTDRLETVRECARRDCRVVILGALPPEWSEERVSVVDRPNDFDRMREVVEEAAQGISP